jgi:hypothetical protein
MSFSFRPARAAGSGPQAHSQEWLCHKKLGAAVLRPYKGKEGFIEQEPLDGAEYLAALEMTGVWEDFIVEVWVGRTVVAEGAGGWRGG